MKTPTALVLLLALAGAACGDGDETTVTTSGDGTIDRAVVFVDSVEFIYLESYPVQVQVVITGNLPTPCHELKWELETTDPSAQILAMWSQIDITVSCIQVLDPFEEIIPIGAFDTGSYTLTVNGEIHPFEI